MPKKYKEIKNKFLDDKLTGQEKQGVRDVENYIDNQIELQWETGSVLIDKCIVDFECDPVTGDPTTWTEDKKLTMNQLLFSTYRDNDWKMSEATRTGQCRFTSTKY